MGAFWTKSFFPKRHMAVTPDDDTDLPGREPWVIYVLTDGNVEVNDCFGATVTYALTAGDIVPVLVKRVLEDTTSDVLALQ